MGGQQSSFCAPSPQWQVLMSQAPPLRWGPLLSVALVKWNEAVYKEALHM
jgi:hypothetical protein